MQHAAHHSHPRPPPVDSLDDNHTVRLQEYTLFQLTANRRTHYPVTPKKEGSSYGLFSTGLKTFCVSWNTLCFRELLLSFVLWFTWQGCAGAVEVEGVAGDAGVLEDVGGAEVGGFSGSLLLSGSITHSLEKEMSSSATSPLKPSPCSYLKTIWEGKELVWPRCHLLN